MNISGEYPLVVFSDILQKFKGYLGINGFIQYLQELEDAGDFVNVVQIEVLRQIGKIDLAEHYAQYREQYIKRYTFEEKEQRMKELAEKQQEFAKKLLDAEETLRSGQSLTNDWLEGETLAVHLLKRYGIKIPARTQGWLNHNMVSLQFTREGVQYDYSRRKGGRGSRAASELLIELKGKMNY